MTIHPITHSKVPAPTIYFWVIKLLLMAVANIVVEMVNIDWGFNMPTISYLMGGLLLLALFFQWRVPRYRPGFYWLVMLLMAVVARLLADNLVDRMGWPLEFSCLIFLFLLVLSLLMWNGYEKNLSIYEVVTRRRELFYWLTVLFAFGLGNSFGDWATEQWQLSYGPSLLFYGGVLLLIILVHYLMQIFLAENYHAPTNRPAWAFWLAFVATGPLGSALGSYLSGPSEEGGLDFGTANIGLLFLIIVLLLVAYLTITKKDMIEKHH